MTIKQIKSKKEKAYKRYKRNRNRKRFVSCTVINEHKKSGMVSVYDRYVR